MESAGLHWRDIRGIQDLAHLPAVDKSDLRAAPPPDLLADDVDATTLLLYPTSGVTGRPLTICRTPWEDRLLHAFRLSAMRGYGMRWRDRRVSIRTFNAREDSWWTKLGFLEQHTFSAFDGPDALRARLLDMRPDLLEGLTTTLVAIAERLTASDRQSFRPRFITAGAEPVTPDRRRRIAEGFAARVYDVYGATEFNLIAAECPRTGLLHLTEGSLIAEVLAGEIVITSLHSYAMPMLRLRLGDRVRQGPVPCPCGAPFATLEAIEGRVHEMFQLPDGRSLHSYVLIARLLLDAPWVRHFQFIQERPDLVRLRVVAPAEVPDPVARLGEWVRFSEEACGGQVRILVEQTAEIPLEANGKFRPVVPLPSGLALN
jgi:phenylacetate-coenzyme A ligase PaaK-like adenylate-forming protein